MSVLYVCFCFLFFKQKTAYELRISDWSSDVCSSDLPARRGDCWRLFLCDGRAVRQYGERLRPGGQGDDRRGSLRPHRRGRRAREPTGRRGRRPVPHRRPALSDRTGRSGGAARQCARSEEQTSELQSLMRISYAALCLKKKKANSKN